MIQAGISSKRQEKKKKLLREVIVRIGLKQEDDEDGITVGILLDSSIIELIMSLKFVRKNKFKKKLERLINMRNINSIFNHKEPIEYIVEVVLRSMPLGNSMDMGKRYDDTIGCATCSLS